MRTHISMLVLVTATSVAACGGKGSDVNPTRDGGGGARTTGAGGGAPDATGAGGAAGGSDGATGGGGAGGSAGLDGGGAGTGGGGGAGGGDAGVGDGGTQATVGPGGGAVSLAGGKVALSFPAGAVAQPLAVGATPAAAPGAIAGAVAGTAFDLQPEGTLFAAPVRLTIGYDPAALATGTDESSLRLYTVGPSGLRVAMPDAAVDTALHTVSARAAHFSTWSIGPLPPTHVDVDFVTSTRTRVRVTPVQGVLRAHVGHCPPGRTCPPPPGLQQHFGCTEADFNPDPAVRPPETTLRCLYAGTPGAGTCVAPPGGEMEDDVSGPGFYCYRAGSYTVEVYSFGTLIAPPFPPAGFTANPDTADGSIALGWTAIQGLPGDISGYYLVRSGGAAGGKTVMVTGASYADRDVVVGTAYTYSLYAVNDAGYSPTAAMAQATARAPRPTGSTCNALRLSFSPASVSLFPGTSADVTVQIMRIDAGPAITLALSLEAGSPLIDLVFSSVTSPNPTTGNGTIHVMQATQAIDAQGNVKVRATDAFGAVCEALLPVHANI